MKYVSYTLDSNLLVCFVALSLDDLTVATLANQLLDGVLVLKIPVLEWVCLLNSTQLQRLAHLGDDLVFSFLHNSSFVKLK